MTTRQMANWFCHPPVSAPCHILYGTAHDNRGTSVLKRKNHMDYRLSLINIGTHMGMAPAPQHEGKSCCNKLLVDLEGDPTTFKGLAGRNSDWQSI